MNLAGGGLAIRILRPVFAYHPLKARQFMSKLFWLHVTVSHAKQGCMCIGLVHGPLHTVCCLGTCE